MEDGVGDRPAVTAGEADDAVVRGRLHQREMFRPGRPSERALPEPPARAVADFDTAPTGHRVEDGRHDLPIALKGRRQGDEGARLILSRRDFADDDRRAHRPSAPRQTERRQGSQRDGLRRHRDVPVVAAVGAS